MNNNKMIQLDGISEDARSILVKAIPHQRGGFTSEDKEYFQLYHDFMKATNSKFVGEGSFNRFQVAVEGMRRKMKTLTYKDSGSIEGAMYKGRVQ